MGRERDKKKYKRIKNNRENKREQRRRVKEREKYTGNCRLDSGR